MEKQNVVIGKNEFEVCLKEVTTVASEEFDAMLHANSVLSMIPIGLFTDGRGEDVVVLVDVHNTKKVWCKVRLQEDMSLMAQMGCWNHYYWIEEDVIVWSIRDEEDNALFSDRRVTVSYEPVTV